jgi:hypothetical protein
LRHLPAGHHPAEAGWVEAHAFQVLQRARGSCQAGREGQGEGR